MNNVLILIATIILAIVLIICLNIGKLFSHETYKPSEAEMRTKPMIESRFSDRFKAEKLRY